VACKGDGKYISFYGCAEGKEVLEILGLAGGNINMYYRNIMGGCGLDSSGLGGG
jgi:hypothetical protein